MPRAPPTFRKAIVAFAASGDIPAATEALASLRRVADSPLPAEYYNIILNALARLRRHDDAIRFYGEMTSVHRVDPDAYTFNILINSSCHAEGVDAAMRWFGEMQRRSCAPTGVSFNTLMRGFFREGRFKEGTKVAREMLELGVGLSVASLEILIGGLCRGGEALMAAEVFVEFLEDGVVPEGFDTLELIEALCRAGRMQKAVEVVDMILEKTKACCLSVPAGVTVLDCLMKARLLDELCLLMGRMVNHGIVPDTISCNCIFEALCESGRTADADRLRLLAKEKGFEADDVTYSMLVQGFGRHGKRKEGEALLGQNFEGHLRALRSAPPGGGSSQSEQLGCTQYLKGNQWPKLSCTWNLAASLTSTRPPLAVALRHASAFSGDNLTSLTTRCTSRIGDSPGLASIGGHTACVPIMTPPK
ncbi:hypothetical protein EJB05_18029, partial [Eragrostis curvula]